MKLAVSFLITIILKLSFQDTAVILVSLDFVIIYISYLISSSHYFLSHSVYQSKHRCAM